jgi:hypothetical protein
MSSTGGVVWDPDGLTVGDLVRVRVRGECPLLESEWAKLHFREWHDGLLGMVSFVATGDRRYASSVEAGHPYLVVMRDDRERGGWAARTELERCE